MACACDDSLFLYESFISLDKNILQQFFTRWPGLYFNNVSLCLELFMIGVPFPIKQCGFFL